MQAIEKTEGNDDTKVAEFVAVAGLLLAAEWGGFRIGPDPDNPARSGLMLRTPAGLLLFLYATTHNAILAHLPLDLQWDWKGAKHRLVCELNAQVYGDLLEYAKRRETERSATASADDKECQTGA